MAKSKNTDKMEDSPFIPIGVEGYAQSSGFVHEEFLQKLSGTRGRKVYRQMLDNSPELGAVMHGINSITRSLSLEVTPAEHPDGQRMAEFVESMYEDMDEALDSHIVSVNNGMYPFGFQVAEIVPKIRNGYEYGNAEKNSRFADGLVGVAKLASRPPESIYRWVPKSEVVAGFPDNGEVWGVEQQPPNGGAIRRIPLSRCLHFALNQRKGNPEGVSAFRTAYRPWYFLKNIQELEAIGIERNLAGLPVVSVPPELFEVARGYDMQGNRVSSDKQANAKRVLGQYERLVRDLKKNARAGVVLSSDVYRDEKGNPTSQQKVRLELLSASSTGDAKISETISRYQQDITRPFFAQFLMFGGGSSSGNRSLSDNMTGLWLAAIDGAMEHIAAVHNRQLLPYIWHLNATAGFDIAAMPKISFCSAKNNDAELAAKMITSLASAGFMVGDDENLENYLRRLIGAPEAQREPEL